ncbi:MAG: RNA methyltransferase [Chlorobiaceae bacterium]|nr:RNA methyltransferase [Chlorobiaceae bacterium]
MTRLEIPALSKARLKYFVRLHQKKFRDSEGLFLAEGLRTVRELSLNIPDEEMLVAILIREGEPDGKPFVQTHKGKVFSINERECSQLSGTTTTQGIFGVFRQLSPAQAVAAADGGKPSKSFIVALDDVQDPGNVGTILRSAVWFGAEAMICTSGSADRYNSKAVRSCAGSIYGIRHSGVERLDLELLRLQKLGYSIVSASLDGKDFREFTSWPEKQVLVVGNEANGVSEPVKALTDRLVRIPHSGRKPGVESLNASVSAAILMERMVL